MLALGQLRAQECPGCGGHLPDTTGTEHEFSWRAEAVICHRCAARDVEVERYRKHPHPGALLYRLTKRGA